MHELSIAQSLVNAVVAEMGKPGREGSRLSKVCVVVGALRSVIPDYLQEAYRAVSGGTVAANAALAIRILPIVGMCEECGWKGEMPKYRFLCGSCGSEKARIVGGLELHLECLEVEED